MTPSLAESEEELKSLLMKVKVESENVGLKLNIQKKQWKQCQTIFLGSKITADGDFSHGIKRPLLLGRKAMINLDSILKSRDITLPTKVWSSQGYGFSCGHVWM